MVLLVLLVVVGNAQNKKGKLYGVAFYNLENLFDTVHDEGKNDYEYLPDGRNKWDEKKYQSKLEHISTVLSLLATDKVSEGAAVIGMAEVENRLWKTEDIRLFITRDRTSGVSIVRYSIIRNFSK